MRLLALAMLLLPAAASAQTPGCDALEEGERAAVAPLLAKLKPYECCDDTFDKCLARPNPCALAVRLAEDLCRKARLGKDAKAIEDAYARRRRSMIDAGPAMGFVRDEGARLGEADAPVTVALYVCTRCPFCRDLVLALHREVTEDSLKGKVKIYLRPFPLKGHEGSIEGATALMAAGRGGKLWPYAVYTYKHFSEFHPAVLADWAEFVKLDRDSFEAAMADEQTREALTEVKKEGVRNKVEATPTLIIDGKRYVGELELGAIVDALLEEHERVTARR